MAICVVYPPLDKNLYQLQKSYENVASAVKSDGTILLVSGCVEGTGDARFLKLAERSANGELRVDGQSEWLLMGIHKVKRTERLSERLKLMLVSKLPASDLEFIPIEPWPELEPAVEKLMERHGTKCDIAVVLDSANQVLQCA